MLRLKSSWNFSINPVMKKLLIVGSVWPEPDSSAAGRRMLELIELFHDNQWRIVFASAAAVTDKKADLAKFAVCEQAIIVNDVSFDRFIAALQPDLVIFDRFFTEEQFAWRVEKVCPGAVRILDSEDLHCLRYTRQRMLKQMQKNQANELERRHVGPVLAGQAELYAQMVEEDVTQREIAAIYRCDLTLIISHYEMRLLTKNFHVPQALLQYCPFLSVKNDFDTEMLGFFKRQHFIAIGNFRHEPNWDSVLYLKHSIWPLIKARLPEAEIHICGAYAPLKAMQLHDQAQGFVLKGWIENALIAMQSARVCLAPLRFGAGVKGKLIDAMRAGTPNVTTLIGAEGLYDGQLWGGLIANDTSAIVDAAVRLYRGESEWRSAQQHGLEILKRYFGQQNHGRLLLERIAQLQTNLVFERKQNIVGILLRHHFLKSTHYMGRWIEEKNKNNSSKNQI